MILSQAYGFLFVHVPKTAGTSIADALGRYGRGENRTLLRSLTHRFPFQEDIKRAYFRKHDTASKMIAKLGRETFDRFLSFSVIRNPFDHAVSHYEFMKDFRIASTARKIRAMSFREYLHYRMKPPFWNDTFFARLPDQTHFLIDSTGAIAVKRLIRFECLASEMERLARDLNLPDFRLQHANPTHSKSSNRPFRSYYDPETEDLVRRLYARDFRLLGYPAELPAL